MSSTTGVKTGNLLHEIGRLRTLLQRKQRRLRAMEQSRDMWRERAKVAERQQVQIERNRTAWDRRKKAA